MDLIYLIILYALIIMISATDSHTEDADYLIVLGSGLDNNKITPCLKDRCDYAINYLKVNPNTKVVVTGGYTNDSIVSEASVMKQYLIDMDIDTNRIIVEDKALDTVENIKYSFKLIDTNSKIVIVSNTYHLCRSKMIAKLYGIKTKAIGVSTDTLDLIKHLIIEEVYIIKNFIRIKKETTI